MEELIQLFQRELERTKEDLKPKPLITQEQKDNTPDGQCPACYWNCKHDRRSMSINRY